MNFGAILGLSLCFSNALFMIAGMQQSSANQWLGYIITIAVISWGTITFRDKYCDGFISYGKAFTSCLQIAFFSGMILSFFLYIYLEFFDQSIIEQILLKAEEEMVNNKVPDEQAEQAMNITRKITTPAFISVMTLLAHTVMGAIFGLITAAFLKRDNPTFNGFIQNNQS